MGSVEQVSPTLGQDQLHAGLIAGALGLLLVVMYLLLYYRALGRCGRLAVRRRLRSRTCIVVILGRQLGFTLSLAGVAGAIVAIGITADSFIVYFERIRDEVREGAPCGRPSRPAGCAPDARIIAADFVSFLAAAVLYFVSVGNVRGFAFTLGLTTLIDVVVVVPVHQAAGDVLARTQVLRVGQPAGPGSRPDRLGHAAEHADRVRRHRSPPAPPKPKEA